MSIIEVTPALKQPKLYANEVEVGAYVVMPKFNSQIVFVKSMIGLSSLDGQFFLQPEHEKLHEVIRVPKDTVIKITV